MDAAECPACSIHAPLCLCKHLPAEKFHSELKIVILQDSAELKPTKRAISSIPILRLLLGNIEVVHCSPSNYHADIDIAVLCGAVDSARVALLYPSDASKPLSDSPPAEGDQSESAGDSKQGDPCGAPLPLQVLIVLDGSWVTVQHILARNAFLHPRNCKHVRLPPSDRITESVYHTSGLRREPTVGFVSTAEAVAWAMHFIGQEFRPAARAILALFEVYIDSKIKSGHKLSSDSIVDSDSGSDCSLSVAEASIPLTTAVLLPSCGVRYKRPISKSEKRKRVRGKEKKRKKIR